jgi:hypothetical protein
LRNTIEGLNGYAKDPAHQALAQPARRRVRGIAAQSIFTGAPRLWLRLSFAADRLSAL